MTTSAAADRLVARERSFIAAVRDGDHDTLEHLLASDFTASAFGEGRIDRREFLRRAIYGEIHLPTTQPTWSTDETGDDRPQLGDDTIGYRWVDGNGTRHGRVSTWHEDGDRVLRMHHHLSGASRFDGTTER